MRTWKIAPFCLLLGGCSLTSNVGVKELNYDPIVQSDTALEARGEVQVEVVDGIVPKDITTSFPKRYQAKVIIAQSSSPHYTSGASLIICSYQSGCDYYFTNGSHLTLCVDSGGKLKGIRPNP